MQIHELPAGSPASGVQFAGDTGTQTQKIDYDALAAAILNQLTSKEYTFSDGEATVIDAINTIKGGLGEAASKGVANDLVTTAAGLVLDARQGKTLKDLHDSNASEISAINTSLTVSRKSYYYNNTDLYVIAQRSGHVVNLIVAQQTNQQLPKNKFFTLAHLDEEFRPNYASVPFVLYDNAAITSSNVIVAGYINTGGYVQVWIYGDAPDANSPRGIITYIVD